MLRIDGDCYVIEGRVWTNGLPLLEWRGLRPGSRCFSRLEAADDEAEADPEDVDTLDLVLEGDEVDWEERELLVIIMSTLG